MTTALEPQAGPTDAGREAYELMERLFPLCRSLTGDGVRATFDVLEQEIPIERTEIPSGTRLFDWIVPEEWNLRDAYVAAPDGTRVVDYRDSTLHVVSYSEPVRATMSLEQLRERLHTLPEQPDVVPYRTSYYERTWGFCLSHRQLLELQPGDYEVVIDSTLEPGHLSYAEHRIEGEGDGEVLVSTYVCHPSLANDNLSGIAVATMLARRLAGRRLRHTYRFLFAPGTIGPLAWLHQNREGLDRIEHGLAVSCIGDEGNLTYKRSRRKDAEVDRAMETVLRDSGAPHRVLPWEPWGGDERQFCSPGFDLPVGTLMRTPHGEFAGYHTSADSLERIRPESLADAWTVLARLGQCEIWLLKIDTDGAEADILGERARAMRALRGAIGELARRMTSAPCCWVLNRATESATLLEIARFIRCPSGDPGAAERLADRGARSSALDDQAPGWARPGPAPRSGADRRAASRCPAPGRPNAFRGPLPARSGVTSGRGPRCRPRASGSPARTPRGRTRDARCSRSVRRRATRCESVSQGAGRP